MSLKMQVLFVVLVSLFASASALFKDQPAVTIFKPNQGQKLPIGSTVATGISWGKPGQIIYSDITVSLVKGDAFVNTVVQDICGKAGKPACPPITPSTGDVGFINLDWVLQPEDASFLGAATILVRAKWDDINSPGVIDTLSQTLTILVVSPTPTPTKKPSPTKKPATPSKKPSTPTPTPATPPPATPTPTKKAAPTPTGKPHATPPCQAGCPPGTFCCNMDCVPGDPATHYCCETGDYPYSCMRNVENCCGYSCCAKGLECCGHGLIQVCCPAGTVCQGALCVSAKR